MSENEFISGDMPAFVEVGPRLYAVVIVSHRLYTIKGTQVLALVNHGEQVIQISHQAPEEERAALLAEAVNVGCPIGWRQVPVLGVVS